MKTLSLFLCTVLLLASCKKDKVNPADVRLLKIKAPDNGTGITHYSSFILDASGRITRIVALINNSTTGTIDAEISYTANKITITPTPIHDAAVDMTTEITYTLNASNRPIQRTENTFREYKAPANNPQRDYVSDTMDYEYDANGLLLKITGKNRDSTWFNPGTVSTSTYNRQSTALYTNTAGNLEKVVKTTNQAYRMVNGTTTILAPQVIEETQVFGYTKGYANQTDFTNAIILTEFQYLYYFMNPIDSKYKNLPDKVSVTKITRDGNTGAVIDTDSSVQDVILNYNGYSFLSSINFGTTANTRRDLIYNK